MYARHGIRLSENAVVIDIGANLGFFTLFVARSLREATIVAIEPVPEVFEMLRRTVECNCQCDVRLVNCAIGTVAGTADITYFPRVSVASSLHHQDSPAFRSNSRRFVLGELARRSPLLARLMTVSPAWLWVPLAETIRRFFHASRRVRCLVRPLADVLQEERLSRIDLLKVDTEGSEDDVLASIAADQWPHIRQVVVEVHHGPESARRMRSFLEDKGFRTAAEPLRDDAPHLFVVYAVR
ncbi:MAG: FkbM family methyltransferase [Planctomycetia bacterium]